MKRKIFENREILQNGNGNSFNHGNLCNNKNRNKRKRTFCENISIPLGIFSAQNNILFPTIKNSNCFISLLSDGNFNNFNGKKNSKNNENYDVELNKIKSNNNLNNNSSNNDLSINRFLVFPVYHLSLATVLPLILSYNSTTSFSTSSTSSGVDRQKEIQLKSANIPPISALFSRDLCLDLLHAVQHCIKW